MISGPDSGGAEPDSGGAEPGGPGVPGRPVGPDRISLFGVRAFGYHGVLRAEREQGQEFVADAVLWLDTSAAAAADDLSRTVDYGGLASRLAGIMSGEPVALIETLAQRLASACLADDRVSQAEITVHKPQAPVGVPVSDVTVTIRRRRS